MQHGHHAITAEKLTRSIARCGCILSIKHPIALAAQFRLFPPNVLPQTPQNIAVEFAVDSLDPGANSREQPANVKQINEQLLVALRTSLAFSVVKLLGSSTANTVEGWVIQAMLIYRVPSDRASEAWARTLSDDRRIACTVPYDRGRSQPQPPPPPPRKIKILKGTWKLTNISQQFIHLEQVITLGTGICRSNTTALVVIISYKLSQHRRNERKNTIFHAKYHDIRSIVCLLPEELLTFCSVIYSNLSKINVFTLHTSYSG